MEENKMNLEKQNKKDLEDLIFRRYQELCELEKNLDRTDPEKVKQYNELANQYNELYKLSQDNQKIKLNWFQAVTAVAKPALYLFGMWFLRVVTENPFWKDAVSAIFRKDDRF